MIIDKEILVVIPYLASGAQGSELELAVTGWRLFFRNPYHLLVVGDHHPVVESGDDISFLPCPRIDPVEGQYLPHLDMVNKFLAAMDSFPEDNLPDGFVYTCDDIYPTADFDIWDIIVPKEPVRGFAVKPYDWRKGKPDWYSDKCKTAELCRLNSIPDRNWVCHLPVYYELDKLMDIYSEFHCHERSFIVENIYFNREFPVDVHARPERQYHDEVTTSAPDIRPLGSVKWVSNANSGWSLRLEQMLRHHYSAFGQDKPASR